MTLTIEIPTDIYEKMEEKAALQGLRPEELLLRFAERTAGSENGNDFDTIADYLLNKNAELYRRLA